MVLQSIGLKFFGKIIRESCFCCSRCISFNPTSHLNSFFSYREILSNYVYKRFQGSQSIKTMVSWVFTFNKFLLTKSNFKIFTHWISIQKQPPGDVLLGECFEGVQQICGGESRWRCVISIELHMQLWGYSSAWMFSCRFCFAFAKHFLGDYCLRLSVPSFISAAISIALLRYWRKWRWYSPCFSMEIFRSFFDDSLALFAY